ncbi:recombinase family protein, partial [Flavonifractor plautii]
AFAQAESESTSSRVRWGKQQAMRSGHVTINYKNLLGYEKGPDGKPAIVPEQAETVRFIYDRYLAGDSVREIKAALEGREIPTVSGKTEWMASHIRSILTNEKYCGDVLL